MNNWKLNGLDFTKTPRDYTGFVYLITNTDNNKKYIGKKLFHKTIKRKTKPKRRIVSSDWIKYHGSSDFLLNDVKRLGQSCFNRDILHLCKSKGEMSLIEAAEQISRNVLIDDSYYNGFIGCKIHSKHITDPSNLNSNLKKIL